VEISWKEDAMRHLRRIAVATATVALWAALAAADSGAPGGRPTIEPVGKVAGQTGGELLRESWKQLLLQPADNEFVGHCLPLFGGKVVMPLIGADGVANCRVKRGTPLFPRLGGECSNVEEPPDFGADEAAQQACALANDQGYQAMNVTIDDGQTVNVVRPRYELLSPQGRVRLPPDNLFEVPPQPATFAAHAWGGIVELRLGHHTITWELVHTDFAATLTIRVNVV
jgi:hypothetical protein